MHKPCFLLSIEPAEAHTKKPELPFYCCRHKNAKEGKKIFAPALFALLVRRKWGRMVCEFVLLETRKTNYAFLVIFAYFLGFCSKTRYAEPLLFAHSRTWARHIPQNPNLLFIVVGTKTRKLLLLRFLLFLLWGKNEKGSKREFFKKTNCTFLVIFA